MNELWLVFLAVATPIAGVVGFAIQIRTVRKVRLENTKLELEIVRLQKELEKADGRIVLAGPEEIEKYGGIRFSYRGPCPGPDDGMVVEKASFWSSIVSATLLYGFLALAVLFVLYLGYDVYRVGRWLWSFL
ncbi:hypothetical protein [Burkholderia sp. LMU1-1-1.1]|uniref:hypothetical protein n=1 Tax=Burkholderia sp. LMU1-1-1.1 TaxID=3135266 RepID=UPI0034312D9B